MPPLEWQIVRFTLAVCAFSTLLILPVGLATAWVADRYRWPGKLLVETVVTLPLVLPPVATGLVLLKMFGRRGPIGHFLSQHFDIDVVFTWRAASWPPRVIVFSRCLFVLLALDFKASISVLSRSRRTLGARDMRVFFTIHASTCFAWHRCWNRPGVRPCRWRIWSDDTRGREIFREEQHAFAGNFLRRTTWPRCNCLSSSRVCVVIAFSAVWLSDCS